MIIKLSFQLDVNLEVDLNGDTIIDVETERASGTFQVGECRRNGGGSFWGSLNNLTLDHNSELKVHPIFLGMVTHY